MIDISSGYLNGADMLAEGLGDEVMALFEAEHLKTRYLSHGKPFSPFEDVSFFLEAGGVYDLTGPSGSGKTTLLRVCARLLPKTAGTLRLNGQDSDGMSPVAWRRQVCLVPQQSVLVPGTVGDNLRLPWTLKVNAGITPPADEELQALLDAVDLNEVSCHTDASQLSGGQQARVALLRAFVTHPKVLLLDEVDAGLDDESAKAVGLLCRSVAQKEGSAVLRIRHRPPDGFATATFVLAQGVMSRREAAGGDKS